MLVTYPELTLQKSVILVMVALTCARVCWASSWLLREPEELSFSREMVLVEFAVGNFTMVDVVAPIWLPAVACGVWVFAMRFRI